MIASLKPLLGRGDLIVDMGNEWYEHPSGARRRCAPARLLYMVRAARAGGESGARHQIVPHAGWLA